MSNTSTVSTFMLAVGCTLLTAMSLPYSPMLAFGLAYLSWYCFEDSVMEYLSTSRRCICLPK